jgi:phosphoribosyl-ATP pyrophosphohydrolase
MSKSIEDLYEAVLMERGADPANSPTARLFDGGRTKIAKKLVEEAAEVSLESVTNNRDDVVNESVDMLYNWVVLLADMGIRPSEIWHEMTRREELLGIAGKLPKKNAIGAR